MRKVFSMEVIYILKKCYKVSTRKMMKMWAFAMNARMCVGGNHFLKINNTFLVDIVMMSISASDIKQFRGHVFISFFEKGENVIFIFSLLQQTIIPR